MKSQASNTPVSDKIIRERTFDILAKRLDRKDAVGQLIITVDEVLKDGFTGQIILNCHSGGINSIQVKETQRLTDV